MENKRIQFSAVDNGVSTELDKLGRKSDELMKRSLILSQKYSQELKDQVKLIEAQINAIGRRNKVDGIASGGGGMPPSPPGGGGEFEQKLLELTDLQYREIELQTSLLRELVENFKGGGSGGGLMPPLDPLNPLNTPPTTPPSTPDNNKPKGVFKDVLAANIVSDIIKGAVGAVNNMASNFVGTSDGDVFAADLMQQGLSGVPIFGQGVGALIGGGEKRHIEELVARDTALNSLRARTKLGEGTMSFQDLGFSQKEALPIAEQLAVASGGSKNLRRDTRDLLSAEMGFGVDRGTLMSMAGATRMQGDGSLGENIIQTINTMRAKGVMGEDFTQLQEILESQNKLIQQQTQTIEEVDYDAVTNITGALRQVGGSFADARSGDRMAQINSAIANPQNDFQKALNFQALSGLDGLRGGSFVDMLEAQEKGITQPGMLAAIMKQVETQFGSGDAGILGLQQRTGLSIGASKQLFNQFQADRTMFDEFSATDEGVKKMTTGDMQSRARGLTTDRAKESAQIDDAFVESMGTGLSKVGALAGQAIIDKLTEHGGPVGETIGNAILKVLGSGEVNSNGAKTP